MNQHWDFLLRFVKNGNDFTVDVKAHKHKWRNGPLLDDYFWIEWKNVRGNTGWISGTADYIAFIYYNNIHFYERCNLKDTARSFIDFNKHVDKSSLALNCIYTRRDRKDEVSLISISRLNKITKPVFSWTIS